MEERLEDSSEVRSTARVCCNERLKLGLRKQPQRHCEPDYDLGPAFTVSLTMTWALPHWNLTLNLTMTEPDYDLGPAFTVSLTMTWALPHWNLTLNLTMTEPDYDLGPASLPHMPALSPLDGGRREEGGGRRGEGGGRRREEEGGHPVPMLQRSLRLLPPRHPWSSAGHA
jgi:hypothetical protein